MWSRSNGKLTISNYPTYLKPPYFCKFCVAFFIIGWANISAKLKRGQPNGGAKCRWGRLKLATFENVDRRKRCQLSSVASLITLSVRLSLQHGCLDAACRAASSASVKATFHYAILVADLVCDLIVDL